MKVEKRELVLIGKGHLWITQKEWYHQKMGKIGKGKKKQLFKKYEELKVSPSPTDQRYSYILDHTSK